MTSEYERGGHADLAPGEEGQDGELSLLQRIAGYLTGLGLAILLQMGVHLVFFLHITTGPDNTNNVLALAFGVLIVVLVIGGSLWIMAHLNHNTMPMDQIIHMQG